MWTHSVPSSPHPALRSPRWEPMEASESSLTWSAGEGSDLLRPGADSVGQCPLPAAWDQVGCEQTGPRWSPHSPAQRGPVSLWQAAEPWWGRDARETQWCGAQAPLRLKGPFGEGSAPEGGLDVPTHGPEGAVGVGEGDLNPGSPQTPRALMPGPWPWHLGCGQHGTERRAHPQTSVSSI